MSRLTIGALFGLLSCAFVGAPVHAATQTAASCSTSAVQTAVNAASDGDTVVIPDGSCAWSSGISTTKQILIRAQNFSSVSRGRSTQSVVITNNSSGPLFQFTSGNNYHVGLTGIRFNEGSGNVNHIRFTGTGSKVPLVNDCYFEVKNRFGNQPDIAIIAWMSQGGVMWNSYVQGVGSGIGGQCCPEGASILVNSPRAWESASTMGSLDTTGTVNVYVEDSTFKNFGQSPDVDDNGRFVMRYSMVDGASGLTHGFTSAKGGRHAEYYNNVFTTTTSNRNLPGRYFWLRAGTVLFTDNDVSVQNMGYGAPSLLDIGDNTNPSGYPQARQPGWGHNGSGSVIDPIYIWNNTGAGAAKWSVESAWASNVQQNREIYVNNGAKPGYSKYTYPHPLRTGGGSTPPTDTTAPSVPTNVSAQAASSSQIDLGWTASTDNVGVTGYRVERCQGTSCTNFSQIGTPSGTSYSDTSLTANTAYRYRVAAVDAAGNVSGYSTIVTATTQTGPPPIDTTAPSAPASLSANPTSSSQVALSWSASTDNVGVTGYRIERCQGSSCSNFSQIGTSTGASYSDTGLSASTAYSYRVRATDAAGNLSGYSNTASATTQSGGGSTPTPLPTGATGIASRFPGDTNIQSDSNVIFADNFESYTSVGQLSNNWNQVFQTAYTRIATEPNNVYSGGKSVEFRVPQQSAEVANALIKNITPAEDTIFLRVYTKFDAGYNVLGSNHSGVSLQAQYCCAGVPANGSNKFYVGLENSRDLTTETSPGMTNLYVYHPEQRSEWGDHWYPDGRVVPFDQTPGDFGPYFVKRSNFTPALDRWYSYELMVKSNTPGQRDGRIAVWIDGNLVADYLNLRLRDVNSLKIDQAVLSFHIFSNTIRQNMKWYDNVVIARQYIGPMSTGSSPGLNPPTNVSTIVY